MADMQNAGEQSPAFDVVDVDGMAVCVNRSRLATWKAYKITSKLRGAEAVTPESLDVMLELIGFATDADEQKIVEHCGGDDATIEAVVTLVAHIVTAMNLKNSSGSQQSSGNTPTN